MTEAPAAIDALIAQGLAAQRAERLGEAERAYRAALAIDSTDPRALALLGTLAGRAGRFALAIELFLRALPRDPGNADLYHNLGETYRHLGETGKALPAFNRAIELRPEHFEAYRSAADTAIAAAIAAEASGGEVHARELRRIAAQYLLKLGTLRYDRRLGVEEIFREAAALDPDDAKILYALGSILHEGSAPSEAVAVLRRAVALAPQAHHAYNNLGAAYFTLRRWAESQEAYRAALALKPDFALAAQSLRSTALMRLLYDDRSTDQEIFARHRAWGAEVAAELAPLAARMPPFANSRDPDRKLRVAYLSGDFREHSVSYFLRPLFEHHDRSRVEVFCYSEVENPDAVTAEIRRLADHWRDSFALGDEALGEGLRADRIDIAIDLAGHTPRNRLRALAVKPAPVAATWLGYPATTGLPAIDYRITDAIADPAGAERFYTEKLVRLDNGFLCYQPLAGAPAVAPLPASAAGFVTFGSFNNPLKMWPSTIAAWALILKAVPRSRLSLKAPSLRDPGVCAFLLEGFAANGIAAERIEFQGFALSLPEHLGSYAKIDIALDPFPYNGTTTSCEAMWMGVPVIALAGERHSARVGLDLLSRVGLAELAAPDVAGYVAAASALARDLPRLLRLRAGLRERMRASPLCDAPGFARGFEAALKAMWRRWCGAPAGESAQRAGRTGGEGSSTG